MAASTITGSVLYHPRIALPPGSIVHVWLEDVSRQDIAAISVAESETVTSGEQVPIPFALAVDASTRRRVDASALVPRARYAFRATIEVGGSIRFTTTASHPLRRGCRLPKSRFSSSRFSPLRFRSFA